MKKKHIKTLLASLLILILFLQNTPLELLTAKGIFNLGSLTTEGNEIQEELNSEEVITDEETSEDISTEEISQEETTVDEVTSEEFIEESTSEDELISNFSLGINELKSVYYVSSASDFDTVRDALAFYELLKKEAKATNKPAPSSPNIELVGDVDLGGINWVPLGTSTTQFTGSLNGNGFKIKNLTINSTTAYQGLFACLNSAVIENLEVEDAKLDIKGRYAGIISGYAYQTSFENVSISGDSYLNNTYAENGSFAGKSTYSAYENCYTNARIKAFSDVGSTASVFGTGQNNTVKNTYSTGNVYGSYASAFMYSSSSNKVENSYYAGVTNATTAFGTSVVSNSYYNSDLAISASDLKYGKTTEEMKKKSTFEGWDFADVWDIDEGSVEYPLPYLNKNINTKSSYYNEIEISTVDDLKNINKDLGNNYRLANDINLTGIDWVPLGTSTTQFTGSLNGNGFKIKNLTINSTTAYQGLFACLNSAVIENLEVEDAKLDIKGRYAGIISGYAYQTSFENVSISGDSYLNNTYAENGSFAGKSTYSAYENCYTNARIKAFSDVGSTASVFGTGQNNTVKNTYSTGNVYGSYASAFMYSSSSNKVENSYYAGVTNATTAFGTSVVSNSYYNSDLAISASDLKYGKTTEEMKKKSTFEGWDFADVWDIDEGSVENILYHT